MGNVGRGRLGVDNGRATVVVPSSLPSSSPSSSSSSFSSSSSSPPLESFPISVSSLSSSPSPSFGSSLLESGVLLARPLLTYQPPSAMKSRSGINSGSFCAPSNTLLFIRPNSGLGTILIFPASFFALVCLIFCIISAAMSGFLAYEGVGGIRGRPAAPSGMACVAAN